MTVGRLNSEIQSETGPVAPLKESRSAAEGQSAQAGIGTAAGISTAAGITTAAGISTARAAELLRVHGPNRLPAAARPSPLRLLGSQLFHFFAVMLWTAAGLALIAGMPELSAAIGAVVILNAVFAFAQENRAQNAADKLRDLMPARVTALRDGRRTSVAAAEVVPTDTIVLGEGDRIPADLTCVRSESLQVDMSSLTGESVPILINVGEPLHAGTFVVGGSGLGTVVATGVKTRLAEIAAMSVTPRTPTPLERDIHRLVRTIAALAAAFGGAFFIVMWSLGVPLSDGFIFGIGVMVALVPEGLLPTVTLSLAIGAQRMSEQNALVRHLESVETLGATTFICTDKTGTLTQNRMNVVEVWTPTGRAWIEGAGYEPIGVITLSGPQANKALMRVATAARDCARGRNALKDGVWVAEGDPMDAAIHALAGRVRLDPHFGEEEVAHISFSAENPTVTSIRQDRSIRLGAPEAVLEGCAQTPREAGPALTDMVTRGLRVLAVALGPPTPDPASLRPGRDSPPRSSSDRLPPMELLGFLGFEDPPRPGVREAIAACRNAGIKVGMITGDHPLTARAIASEIGLALPGSPVVLGDRLPTDDQLLGELIDHDGVVLARMSPEQKVLVARALRRRGHVVAMTGDGVNDAPALREADIGVAMGASGTDVARECADLVLLDDHFGTIVAAARQGRATFLNTRRFLTYHLTENVAELAPFLLWAATGGRFPLAIGVLQILAIDLGTGTLPATALGAEAPGAGALSGRPVTGALLDRTVARRAFGLLGPLEALWSLAVFVLSLAAMGWRPGQAFPGGHELASASGAAFLTIVVMQCANAFACRSSSVVPARLGWLSNRFLVLAVAVSASFAFATLSIPAVAAALGQAMPPADAIAPLILAPVALLGADAVWKLGRAHRMRRDRTQGISR